MINYFRKKKVKARLEEAQRIIDARDDRIAKIAKDIEYLTKVCEDILGMIETRKDPKQAEAEAQRRISAMMDRFSAMPGMKDNPVFDQIRNVIAGTVNNALDI